MAPTLKIPFLQTNFQSLYSHTGSVGTVYSTRAYALHLQVTGLWWRQLSTGVEDLNFLFNFSRDRSASWTFTCEYNSETGHIVDKPIPMLQLGEGEREFTIRNKQVAFEKTLLYL